VLGYFQPSLRDSNLNWRFSRRLYSPGTIPKSHRPSAQDLVRLFRTFLRAER
jgi:hypothetical protein